jgi:hypothetical protein
VKGLPLPPPRIKRMTRARLRTVFTVLAKRGVVRTGGMGQAGTAKGKKRRTRLKSGGQVPGSAPRAARSPRVRRGDVGGGIDPTLYPASPSATVLHMKSPVAPPATTIRGAGPPGAPAAAKQDDPATDVEYPRAVEDMKDFANNTGGNSGANDNAHHQRGGQIRRR